MNKKILALAVAGAIGFSPVASAGYYELVLKQKDQAVAEQMTNKMIDTYNRALSAHTKAIATFTRLGNANKVAYHTKKANEFSAKLAQYQDLLSIIKPQEVNTIKQTESVITVEENNNDKQAKYETTAKNDQANQSANSSQNTDTTETSNKTEAVNEVTTKTVTDTSTTQVETTSVTILKEQVKTVEEIFTTTQTTKEETNTESETSTTFSDKSAEKERSLTADSFVTTEFDNTLRLGDINAHIAYSRGYTGKGSIVVVADSGANVNHTDLNDNIVATKNFLDGSDDVTDNVGHGTHVAGIIAAEKNNSGTQGVAFNAKLMVAKVTDNRAFSEVRAIQAAQWGQENGAIVINVSANTTYFDNNFKRNLVKLDDGSFYNTHYFYGINGYNGAKQTAEQWKSALGNEMVLVRAAGNTNLDYAAGGNQLATATDDNGNLILDGQMIIVGNWNGTGVSGSKAGNVCTTYVNNECKDAAKVSDFYILAPGTWNSTYGSDYKIMSGTSMAAPAVSGAIAILHEMWPHMKGKYLVELVLKTANKDLPGYQEHVHGQGLLDLDAATQPQGVTGIPTTGRTDGGVTQLTGVVAGSTAGAEELASVMVLDGYERDYYVDLSKAVFVDTRTNNVAKSTGVVNFFDGYGRTDQQLSAVYQISDTVSVQPGFTYEEGTYLGNTQSGVYGNLESSVTTYANVNYNKQIQDLTVFGQFGVGLTNANFDTTNTMLVNADNILSTTWTFGAEYNGFGTALSQPIMIESANMTYDVPTARTLDGAVITERKTVNFKGKRELDFSVYYKYNVNNVEIKTYAEQRMGPIDQVNAGISANFKF